MTSRRAKNLLAVRRVVKPVAERTGIDGVLKFGLYRGRRVGEDLRILLLGRPAASSTILLAGSARSGTSWVGGLLAQTGGVQILFEPLNPPNNDRVRALTGWDKSLPTARSPYLRPDGEYPEWYDLLEKVLTGQYRHYVTDFERTSYWPERYLIKGIRFNMMLGYIYDHFRTNIVHLVRHPCAVVYSRLHRERGLPWQASVADILSQEQLMEDHLLPWAGRIERETDALGAHAVWWSAENMVAQKDLRERPHARLFYEELCLTPEQSMMTVLETFDLNRDSLEKLNFRENSRTTATQRDHSTRARLEAWKHGFSQEEQQRIIYWARELGVTWYDEGIMPQPAP